MKRVYTGHILRIAHAALVALGSAASCFAAADLLNDPLNFSGSTLHIRPYAATPAGYEQINSMTFRPGDDRMYVTTIDGAIFTVTDNGNATTTTDMWFDVEEAVADATDRMIFFDGAHDGFQGTAFHPGFDDPLSPGYGKFYTTLVETRPASTAGHRYLGNPNANDTRADSVLVEWTYNHGTQQAESSSYRELFRISFNVKDHLIKQARFNPYANPGDEDYGLLYITNGDNSSQASTEDRPQMLNEASGKMFRIDPLEAGSDPYSIPTSNPFFADSDPSVLQEIYAYGFRNPHNYSFNEDDEGNVHILVGDIGRSNIEEVNLVVKGGNYGWTEREGTRVHRQGFNDNNTPGPDNAGYLAGVLALPEDEASVGMDARGNRYIYPVAQWDHNGPGIDSGDDFTAHSIASGFVISNGSDPNLDNQLVHMNFSFNHGQVYHNDFDEILNAVTQLDPNDPSRDQPSELTQSVVHRLHLLYDDDNNPATAEVPYDDFNNLLSPFFAKNDSRFGEGLQGEMYISTKWDTGRIFLVSNTIPYDADFDGDEDVDGEDFLIWQRNTTSVGYGSAGDANHDGLVNEIDLAIWEEQYGREPLPLATTTVPEPTGVALCSLALLVLLNRNLYRRSWAGSQNN